MKVEYKGIIFDEFTIEKTNGKIIDISKTNEDINLNDISYAWTYICEKHAKQYNLNIKQMTFEMEGMICYVNKCRSFENVYSFCLDSKEDIKQLIFIKD